MKKILATTLVGMLSLFIQSNSIAEDVVAAEPAPAPSAAAPVEVAPSGDSAAPTAEVAAEAAPVEEAVVAKVEPPMPAILGKSVSVHSLRGGNKVDNESEEFPNRRIMVVDGGIEVTFGDQPPMVPHNIDKDRISLQENTCLKCHSKEASKLDAGPKPTPSHFRGRDGKKGKKIVAGRYFCTQCHMPQANIKPLIKNNFTD